MKIKKKDEGKSTIQNRTGLKFSNHQSKQNSNMSFQLKAYVKGGVWGSVYKLGDINDKRDNFKKIHRGFNTKANITNKAESAFGSTDTLSNPQSNHIMQSHQRIPGAPSSINHINLSPHNPSDILDFKLGPLTTNYFNSKPYLLKYKKDEVKRPRNSVENHGFSDPRNPIKSATVGHSLYRTPKEKRPYLA